jgi:sugar/nucleoside kinase (ribokinase family)
MAYSLRMNASSGTPSVIVAGHICLDVIPSFKRGANSLSELLVPGKLVDVGPAILSTGGAVANTGLALHRLGVPVRLMGKIGRDAFGDAVCGLLRQQGDTLADGMLRDASVATSYTVVINPPGIDRVFLHCPGANDAFGAEDLDPAALAGARLLHFGYPPLMRRLYSDGGDELARLLGRARAAGLTTSLDMALPDPDSPAGRADWPTILRKALPLVDVFVPSLDEVVFMLDRARGQRVREAAAAGQPLGGLTAADIQDVAAKLVDLGAAVVLLKLGHHGAYLRATSDAARLKSSGACAPAPDAWCGASLHAPCYRVKVAGTTGAGDCTIAGFLAALVRGEGPADALRAAVATGSASVEHPDATSGIPHWSGLAERLRAGWPREPSASFPHSV